MPYSETAFTNQSPTPKVPNPYSILVNSSDGFEDCWAPFFFLLNKYWPDCNAPIFLNTEKKTWTTPEYAIRCTQVQLEHARKLTWSECLLEALNKIETPLVLYFQEDYFIHQPVRSETILSAVSYMIDNPNVKHIALTRHGPLGPHENYNTPWLKRVRKNARYRISTQAGLWRVNTLKSYLRPEENGWMFEIYGTWRARKNNDLFLCASYDQIDGGPAIDYLHTGIIKGKWLPEIENIFKSNGLSIDFSRRGFYKEKNPLLRKLELASRLLENPKYLLKQIF